MKALTTFLRIEILVLTVSLASIVAYRLLTGQINMSGLLFEKTTDGAARLNGSLASGNSRRSCVSRIFLGGNFKSRKDCMHIQVTKQVLNRTFG